MLNVTFITPDDRPRFWSKCDTRYGPAFVQGQDHGTGGTALTKMYFTSGEGGLPPSEIGADHLPRKDERFTATLAAIDAQEGKIFVAPEVTAFRERVWRALCDIPVGETLSYKGLAEKVGCGQGSQAIGGAMAANEIAWAIPCHRVIRTDGSLGGYRWGLAVKTQMLRHEHTTANS